MCPSRTSQALQPVQGWHQLPGQLCDGWKLSNPAACAGWNHLSPAACAAWLQLPGQPRATVPTPVLHPVQNERQRQGQLHRCPEPCPAIIACRTSTSGQASSPAGPAPTRHSILAVPETSLAGSRTSSGSLGSSREGAMAGGHGIRLQPRRSSDSEAIAKVSLSAIVSLGPLTPGPEE